MIFDLPQYFSSLPSQHSSLPLHLPVALMQALSWHWNSYDAQSNKAIKETLLYNDDF
jgi:hypothetical protein